MYFQLSFIVLLKLQNRRKLCSFSLHAMHVFIECTSIIFQAAQKKDATSIFSAVGVISAIHIFVLCTVLKNDVDIFFSIDLVNRIHLFFSICRRDGVYFLCHIHLLPLDYHVLRVLFSVRKKYLVNSFWRTL